MHVPQPVIMNFEELWSNLESLGCVTVELINPRKAISVLVVYKQINCICGYDREHLISLTSSLIFLLKL